MKEEEEKKKTQPKLLALFICGSNMELYTKSQLCHY